MHIASQTRNPFALLLDPQAVIDAVERSGRLQRLSSRICRPLDKPMGLEAAAEDATLEDIISGDDDRVI